MHVVVVGAGFAGTILARVARSQGHDVTLIDKGGHPRFALGESSTPLAAISLERLAARYGLDDLHHLATYGRWQSQLPELRCGLKRGFTFYRHGRGRPFDNDAVNANRLLVAASPNDAVADTHWFRADVDHFLVGRAQAEGVRYLDHTRVKAVEREGETLRLMAERSSGTVRLVGDLLVDASGAAGAVARQWRVTSQRSLSGLRTGLVYGHFTGVKPLRSVVPDTTISAGPFPDERAAVHHLLDEGWMYELRFDDDVVSAGFVVELAHGTSQNQGWNAKRIADDDPEETFQALVQRYPTLAAQFQDARPVRPVATIPLLQRRLIRAAGDRWAALPHTYMFWSPLFSTGIAWSLLGVERLGLMLERPSNRRHLASALYRYRETLRTEGDHVRQLVECAYRCRQDFDAFAAFSQVYFAAASYCETVQRLCEPPAGFGGEWAWWGFLGATDLALRRIVDAASQMAQADASKLDEDSVRDLIAFRNVAGLADPARHRLYPVDLDALVRASQLIGLGADDARARLPRLRGDTAEIQ